MKYALVSLFAVSSLFGASKEPRPSHRRTSRLEVTTNGGRRTLTISTVNTTMVNGELVRCKVCGSSEITESITVDDSTIGFCDIHKGDHPINQKNLPGVINENKAQE